MSGQRVELVLMQLGRLLLDPPGRAVFHRSGRAQWPTYPADPEKPGFAICVGDERHWTVCGRLSYDSARGAFGPSLLQGVRRDNAELVARPCKPCFRR